MLEYIHYVDPNSEEMLLRLDSIPKTPGICFFMDINKSTDLKYIGGLRDWGRKLNNTFNHLIYANHLEKYVVKGIGDEIMVFIPVEELNAKTGFSTCFSILEDIYSALFLINHHPDPDVFLRCKVAIHYGTEVYNITFLEGANDYYGSDVDLTARLMSKAIESRIVVSESFYIKVLSDLVSMSLPADTGCLSRISDKYLENFRGVPVSTEFRFIDVD